MSLVSDALIILAWAFEEQFHSAEAVLERIQTEEIFLPAHAWFEIRNGLIINERRGRITERACSKFLESLSRLTVAVDRSPEEGKLLSLARRHRLTVYDAAYLELALRQMLPMATLDAALIEAAQAEAVPLIGETG